MRRRWLWWIGALVLAGAVVVESFHYLRRQSLLWNEERLRVEVLSESPEPLRERFNAAADRFRLVVVASPMAPAAVARLNSVWDGLLRSHADAPIEVIVIYIHVLPWDNRGKARSRPRWAEESRLSFFWDPAGLVLDALPQLDSNAALRGDWLLYRPGTSWTGASLPEPELVAGAAPKRALPAAREVDGDLEAVLERLAG